MHDGEGLSDDEIREINEILAAERSLPADWKYRLFPPERREAELVYAGKIREEDVLAETMGVPVQDVRTFATGKQAPADGWHNRLIFGDNLQALKGLTTDPKVAEKVRFVYIDPPFATQREFNGTYDQKAYLDKLAGAEFIEFLRKRLIVLRELLHPNGVIAIHLDVRKGHYAKLILDELFGEHNFLNEVIWKRTGARSGSGSFNHIHDDIYIYTRGRPFTWNVQHTSYTQEYLDDFFKAKDADGRRYRQTILTAAGVRTGSSGKPWRGYNPTERGRHWAVPGYMRPQLGLDEGADTMDALDALDAMGRVLWPKKKDGVPSFKQYADEMAGVELQSIWTDVKPVSAQANEQQGYPTQKPEALLERLIRSFTEEESDDLVLDCFMGSGTTCAVAEKLGRRWIGIDSGKLAVYTSQRRMLRLRKEVGNRGRPLKHRPFVLQNAGLYDFSTLRELPPSDWRFFALQLFECKDRPHRIGRLEVDGVKGGAPVLVFDWKSDTSARITEETIDDLHSMIGSFIGPRFYIIAPMLTFEFHQDYIERDGTRFYALRIPYSIIHELHSREFESILQARGEADLNGLVESYGFGFSIPPEVEWKARGKKGAVVLETRSFTSRAKVKGTEEHGGRETLSLLLVDSDYNAEVFDLDHVFYGSELEAADWKVELPVDEVGKQLMAVWIDHHGNEAKAVIPKPSSRSK